MSLSNVEGALMSAAATALGSMPIEMENAPLNPKPTGKWASLHFMPNQATVETLGPKGINRYTGLLQVTLRYPKGTGTSDMRSDYDALESALPAGTYLSLNGQKVMLLTSGRSRGTLVDIWFSIYVTIAWYAEVPRSR
jgi:hypothetical protein